MYFWYVLLNPFCHKIENEECKQSQIGLFIFVYWFSFKERGLFPSSQPYLNCKTNNKISTKSVTYPNIRTYLSTFSIVFYLVWTSIWDVEMSIHLNSWTIEILLRIRIWAPCGRPIGFLPDCWRFEIYPGKSRTFVRGAWLDNKYAKNQNFDLW